MKHLNRITLSWHSIWCTKSIACTSLILPQDPYKACECLNGVWHISQQAGNRLHHQQLSVKKEYHEVCIQTDFDCSFLTIEISHLRRSFTEDLCQELWTKTTVFYTCPWCRQIILQTCFTHNKPSVQLDHLAFSVVKLWSLYLGAKRWGRRSLNGAAILSRWRLVKQSL